MVNLRFHIVSITAVFLALAVGIFMGSTLLQRVTVDSLRSRQASLDEKIQDRVEENTAFRDALGSYDSQMESFGDDGLPPLLGGQLSDPVITVAMRGIDEASLDAAREDLVASGATDTGTIWFDEGVDVSDEGRRSQVAEALDLAGVEVDEEAVRDQLAEAVSEALAPSTSVDAGDPAAAAEGAAALEQLQADGLLEWETPQGAPRSLPATGLRVVVASGEGAELGADAVAIPLLRELVRTRPGVAVAAELMNPRSSVGEVERELDGQEPVRGAFVDAVVGDEELGDRISTIDDLDQPFGRLTLVQVLAEGLDAAPGRYGRTESATQQFPPDA